MGRRDCGGGGVCIDGLHRAQRALWEGHNVELVELEVEGTELDVEAEVVDQGDGS